MIYLSEEELDKIIQDDVPYWDITTELLNLKGKAKLVISNRNAECVLCGSEEASRIAKKLSLEVTEFKPSGSKLLPNEVFFKAFGDVKNVHKAWRICANLMEHMSGIATKTYEMVKKAKAVNENIEIVTTRKSVGFNKRLIIKSILTGGAMPHRLGLSDSILIFDQHKIFFKTEQNFIDAIKRLKQKAKEHKVSIEVSSLEEAVKYVDIVDMIQFDKMAPSLLKEAVSRLKSVKPSIIILIAGGVNLSNVEEYARTGVDVIVTSSLFSAAPADFKATIEPI